MACHFFTEKIIERMTVSIGKGGRRRKGMLWRQT